MTGAVTYRVGRRARRPGSGPSYLMTGRLNRRVGRRAHRPGSGPSYLMTGRRNIARRSSGSQTGV